MLTATRRPTYGPCLWLALATLLGCASLDVETEPRTIVPLLRGDSYGWLYDPASTAPDDVLDVSIQQWFDRELAAKGLRRSAPDDALWLVTFRTDVDEQVEDLNPYYAMYTSKKYERGTITFDVLDPTTLERVWRGEASGHLRYVANSVGLFAKEWVPIEGNEQVWPLASMTGAIVGAMPLADTAEAPRDLARRGAGRGRAVGDVDAALAGPDAQAVATAAGFELAGGAGVSETDEATGEGQGEGEDGGGDGESGGGDSGGGDDDDDDGDGDGDDDGSGNSGGDGSADGDGDGSGNSGGDGSGGSARLEGDATPVIDDGPSGEAGGSASGATEASTEAAHPRGAGDAARA